MDAFKGLISEKSARIAVIGLGYVGLSTAVAFADAGFQTVGVTRTQSKVDTLNAGNSYLPDVQRDTIISSLVGSGLLKATTNVEEAVECSDVIIITVPTPLTKSMEPDLTAIKDVGKQIGKTLDTGQLIILESTVYPGVTEDVLAPLLEESGLKAGKDFGLAYCPERYNVGDIAHSISNTPRIVGGITDEWGSLAVELYLHITKYVSLVKNIKTAEATKLTENIQRDVNIALMNELAVAYPEMGVDIEDVIDAASTKWNFNVYNPGAGVGGECLPVNAYYLTYRAQQLGHYLPLIRTARLANDAMPYHVVKLTLDALRQHQCKIDDSRVTVLGVSYKPNIADRRGSPSYEVIDTLKNHGVEVRVSDPYLPYNEIEVDVLDDTDVIILMTAHMEYLTLDFKEIKEWVRTPIIIDGRRRLNGEYLKSLGFTYKGVGVVNGSY
jgi:nucleotide sugar dehydrogenase